MFKSLRYVVIVSLLSVAGCAQTVSTAKASEDHAKLEKEAIEFLRETLAEVGRLRTIENRISFSSELASLMWFHDEKEARAMYGNVVLDFKQLLAHFDAELNSPQIATDDDMTGPGLFGGYGKSKVERKFRIAMAVRQQIAMSLAEHAPDMAYNFFYDTQSIITNAQFRKETEQTDKNFEFQLIKQIAETDAAKAAEYGKASMKTGLQYSHIELLKKIYARDADKGIEFGAAILAALKDEKGDIKNAFFFSALLEFGSSNFETSKKPGGKKPVYDQSGLKDIAEQFAQFLLEGPEEDYMAIGYADEIGKWAPGRAAQIKAKFGKTGRGVSNSYNAIANAQRSVTNAMTYSSANTSAISNTSSPERLDAETRARAEKQMMADVLGLKKELPKEERDKVVAQARKIISQTPGKDKKIMSLSMLAAQVARAGDKDLAAEIMLGAERFVNPEPKNYQDFLLSWVLASGYAEVNPDKAFPVLETAILRANETLAAFVKVGEFIDVNKELIDDGEVQVGMFGGSMIRGFTGELGMASGTIKTLIKADFKKTCNLTNVFDRTELRILAKTMVLRAALDKREIKMMTGEETMKDMMEGDDAPPPPMPTKPRPN